MPGARREACRRAHDRLAARVDLVRPEDDRVAVVRFDRETAVEARVLAEPVCGNLMADGARHAVRRERMLRRRRGEIRKHLAAAAGRR